MYITVPLKLIIFTARVKEMLRYELRVSDFVVAPLERSYELCIFMGMELDNGRELTGEKVMWREVAETRS